MNTGVNTPCFIISSIFPLTNISFISLARTVTDASEAYMKFSAVTPNMSADFSVLRDFSASLISFLVTGCTSVVSFLHMSINSKSSLLT